MGEEAEERENEGQERKGQQRRGRVEGKEQGRKEEDVGTQKRMRRDGRKERHRGGKGKDTDQEERKKNQQIGGSGEGVEGRVWCGGSSRQIGAAEAMQVGGAQWLGNGQLGFRKQRLGGELRQ